jgi:hypothetical protein
LGVVWYILDDNNNPVPVSDILVWGRWFEEASVSRRRIVASDFLGATLVSTVFLGIDHGFSWEAGPPLLFETMIFYDQDYGDEMGTWRYSTWTQAVAGHDQALMVAREQLAKLAAVVDQLITESNSPEGE